MASKSAILKEKIQTPCNCRPFQRPGIVMSENYVLYVTVFSSTFFQEIQFLVELIELEGPNNALSFDGSIIKFSIVSELLVHYPPKPSSGVMLTFLFS